MGGSLSSRQAKKGITPFLSEGHPELSMNLSHGGNYAVLAAEKSENWSNETEKGSELIHLGVDIMPLTDSRIKRSEEFFRIMRRQFTDNEWKTIQSFDTEEDQLASFYRHWSLKEDLVIIS